MIQSEAEYQGCLKRLEEHQKATQAERERLEKFNVPADQIELAKRLAVDVSQIYRDERNEYHGISIERAARVVAALSEELQISVRQKINSPN